MASASNEQPIKDYRDAGRERREDTRVRDAQNKKVRADREKLMKVNTLQLSPCFSF